MLVERKESKVFMNKLLNNFMNAIIHIITHKLTSAISKKRNKRPCQSIFLKLLFQFPFGTVLVLVLSTSPFSSPAASRLFSNILALLQKPNFPLLKEFGPEGTGVSLGDCVIVWHDKIAYSYKIY